MADIKNIGKAGQAGTIVAALFLREFVGEGIPWAHLDIAGTAWTDADDVETPAAAPATACACCSSWPAPSSAPADQTPHELVAI